MKSVVLFTLLIKLSFSLSGQSIKASQKVDIDVQELTTKLAQNEKVIELPTLGKNGVYTTVNRYRVYESQVMHPDLQKKYPSIKTYQGVQLGNPSSTVAFTIHDSSLAGVLQDGNGKITEIQHDQHNSYSLNHKSFDKKDNCGHTHSYGLGISAKNEFNNDIETQVKNTLTTPWPTKGYGDKKITYRLAVALQGEYAEKLKIKTKAAGLALIVNLVNDVNLYLNRDFGIHLELIPKNDSIIYLDTSDPYKDLASPSDADNFIYANQTNLDKVIGVANYDIGHIICWCSVGRGALKGPCSNEKAQGGSPNHAGLFRHEVGHQFDGRHTDVFVSGNYISPQDGAGSLVGSNQEFFISYNLQRMSKFIHTGNGNNCPVITPSGNTPPSVNETVNGKYIPTNTPFIFGE